MPLYTYTGQASYMDDPSTAAVTEGFGLMFYNARWYDPSLGRFAQADTMIPLSQGVQAWDRYSYVNNSPVRYNDPTGHQRATQDEAGSASGCSDDLYCVNGKPKEEQEEKSGCTFTDDNGSFTCDVTLDEEEVQDLTAKLDAQMVQNTVTLTAASALMFGGFGCLLGPEGCLAGSVVGAFVGVGLSAVDAISYYAIRTELRETGHVVYRYDHSSILPRISIDGGSGFKERLFPSLTTARVNTYIVNNYLYTDVTHPTQ
jgi:RHS repeat-associated protein